MCKISEEIGKVSRTHTKKQRISVVSNGNRTRRMYVCISDVFFCICSFKKMIFNHLFYLFISCFDSTTWIVVPMKARRGHRMACHRGTGNHELL